MLRAVSVRVGIPTLLDGAERLRAGRRTHYLDAAYARALEAAGALPVYLPPGAPEAARAEALLAAVDGLLLPGGDDLLPEAPYPEGVRFEPVPGEQLESDRALLRAARDRALPILGICYGMQLLAHEAGGALLYDLPTDAPEAGPHQLSEEGARHGLRLEAGTRLAAILAGAPLAVNSRHHQGVRTPGRGLRVAARADDGLVEAIEAVPPGGASALEAPFVVAVQWHPETMEAPHRDALFGAFVAACRGAAGGSRRGHGRGAGESSSRKGGASRGTPPHLGSRTHRSSRSPEGPGAFGEEAE